MEFALNIAAHVPTWVWAILGYIIVMGLKQTREMRLSKQRLIALPGFWLCFGAWGVIGHYGLVGLPTLAWVAGLSAGLMLVLRLVSINARYDAEESRYVVPGSWLPLGLMLGIFCAKFGQGVTLALHPQWGAMLSVQLATGLVFGTISGCMVGRSASILRKSAQPAGVAFA